ncbi:hypothetical protein [Nocardia arthritidis]|uniref:Uncharacterized protein n=1 Tax=Nocardia arthritidis TaxID=228602 RepID=A0A6G9Y9V3_9NOCA|nr:hypothetical protein [Nocardia arthritidis]QIS09991.1 hypothetical protein F5544_10465 [Nocardia arthritidis]
MSALYSVVDYIAQNNSGSSSGGHSPSTGSSLVGSGSVGIAIDLAKLILGLLTAF